MYVGEVQGGESGDEVPVWKEQTTGAPTIDEQLSREQTAEMAQLLVEFAGKMNLIEHDLTTGSARPIRLPPYRLPHAYRQAVQEELEEMQASGIEFTVMPFRLQGVPATFQRLMDRGLEDSIGSYIRR
jgi:hypothetical protein